MDIKHNDGILKNDIEIESSKNNNKKRKFSTIEYTNTEVANAPPLKKAKRYQYFISYCLLELDDFLLKCILQWTSNYPPCFLVCKRFHNLSWQAFCYDDYVFLNYNLYAQRESQSSPDYIQNYDTTHVQNGPTNYTNNSDYVSNDDNGLIIYIKKQKDSTQTISCLNEPLLLKHTYQYNEQEIHLLVFQKLLRNNSHLDPSAFDNHAIHMAITNDLIDVVDFLLKNYHQVKYDVTSNEPLYQCLYFGYDQMLLYLFKHPRFHVNWTLDESELFVLAVQNNRYKIVKYMLENATDIDPNIQDNICINKACQCGYVRITKLLLKHGVDVANHDNRPLRWACKYGHTKIVKLLLSDAYYDRINIAAKNYQAILLAIKCGNKSIVKTLLRYKQRIENTNFHSTSLFPLLSLVPDAFTVRYLPHAAICGNLDLIKMLTKRMDGIDKLLLGNTIQNAAQKGHINIICFLLDKFSQHLSQNEISSYQISLTNSCLVESVKKENFEKVQEIFVHCLSHNYLNTTCFKESILTAVIVKSYDIFIYLIDQLMLPKMINIVGHFPATTLLYSSTYCMDNIYPFQDIILEVLYECIQLAVNTDQKYIIEKLINIFWEYYIEDLDTNFILRRKLFLAAVEVNHVPMIKILIDGIHTDRYFKRTICPIDPAINNNAAIEIACEKGYDEIVQLLLLCATVDPTSQNNSPIILAAQFGHKSIVDMMLDIPGVDPSDQQNKAIFTAISHEHVAVVKCFLKIDTIIQSLDFQYAIFMAAQTGCISIVKMLLDHFDIHNISRQQFNNLLGQVAEAGYMDVVNLLLYYDKAHK